MTMDVEQSIQPFDVAIVSKVKQGDLFAAMESRGWSQVQLGEYLGLTPTGVGRLLNLRGRPSQKWLDSKDVQAKLMELTGKLPDDLWPGWVTNDALGDIPKQMVQYRRTVTTLTLGQARRQLILPPSQDEIVKSRELKAGLSGAVGTLTPREADVISRRYGLDGHGEHTLDELAEVLRVSRERVRQIEAKALRKLRHKTRSDGLAAFL